MPLNKIDQKQIQERIRAEKDVDSLLRSLSKEMRTKLLKKYKKDELVRDLTLITTAFRPLIEAYWDEIEQVIYNRAGSVQGKVIKDQRKGYVEYLASAKRIAKPEDKKKIDKLIVKTNKEFDILEQRNEGLLKARKVFDDQTIGDRIKSMSGATKRTVQNIVADGIQKGKSAGEIAKDIDAYIKGGIKGYKSPYDYYRERFGKEGKKTIFNKLITKGYIREGSVSYQSLRIARSEINMTARIMQGRINDGSAIVKGYKWHLSAQHPFYPYKEICEIYAEKKLWKTIPSYPHPNCMCYTTVVPIKKKDFLKTL